MMKHRSFLIEIEPGCGPDVTESFGRLCDGYYCRIYADADLDRDYELDSFSVVVGDDIPSASDTLFYDFIRHHIDADLMNYLMERSDRMERILTDKLGLAACLLRENRTDEELYDTLRERIGLSDESIRAIGLTSLVPFFDRKEYANNIALWLMDEGTISNKPLDYRISFDTVNSRYGVQLPEDRELLDEIVSHLNPDVVDEVKTDNGFQISFNEHACPYEDPDVPFDFFHVR